MKDIPAAERPYEKCVRKGPSYLSDSELLAVILRNGSVGESALTLARRILYDQSVGEPEGLVRLANSRMTHWQHIRGIGKVKALQMACLGEISKRISLSGDLQYVTMSSPEMTASLYMESMRHLSQEIVKVLFLNSKSKRTGECDISKGTVNASLISPREIFIEAVQHEAVFIIVLHNHPSGDPTPSRNDIELTDRIEHAGKMLGIPLIDHIIIGDRCFYSFEEHGMIGQPALC